MQRVRQPVTSKIKNPKSSFSAHGEGMRFLATPGEGLLRDKSIRTRSKGRQHDDGSIIQPKRPPWLHACGHLRGDLNPFHGIQIAIAGLRRLKYGADFPLKRQDVFTLGRVAVAGGIGISRDADDEGSETVVFGRSRVTFARIGSAHLYIYIRQPYIHPSAAFPITNHNNMHEVHDVRPAVGDSEWVTIGIRA